MGDLSIWQASLEEHFSNLAQGRVGEGVFALEHGLDAVARTQFTADLRSACAEQAPSASHWLAWTVYATELGYEYAGREYWQTFEKETKGWRGSREWVRECFGRFARTFSGFRPSGRWADHFSIICWPIAHAILPRDLQTRVARILYDVRYSFSAATFEDPGILGGLISTRGWLESSRLEQIADEPELIGRIALALLLPEKEHPGAPFLPAAASRIANDLAEHRRAREWLKEAQRVAGSVSLKGLRRSSDAKPPAAAAPANATEARRTLDALGVQPAVFLEPSSGGRLVWVRPPNLSPLIAKFPELRAFLTQARGTVLGSSGEPLARQRVLQGDQRVRLHTWPKSTDVLLRFENAPELLQTLLSAECLLRPGPTWMFRIASDAVAYELRGRLVRPEQDYIFLATEELQDDVLKLVPEPLACSGLHAYRLRTPGVFSEEYLLSLRALGVSVARSARVWPAGLAAAGWDGSGYGEWLAGERPCVAASTDYDVESLTCKIAGFGELAVPRDALRNGALVFLELPRLPVGAHLAQFELKGKSGRTEMGELEILIRDRRPWAPGLTHDGALTVVVDPPSPTLEELWSERVSIDGLGPSGRTVGCRVRFWHRPGRKVFFERQLPPMPLPMLRHHWRTHFRKHCRLEEACQNAYDEAHGVTLDFVADDVGRFELTTEREFVPLRWISRYRNRCYFLRLQDDRGDGSTLTIRHYGFEAPGIGKAVRKEGFLAEGEEATAGLYVASAGDWEQAIVVAPRTFHLQEVKPEHHVEPGESSVSSIVELLRVIELWSRARQVGSTFSLRFATRCVQVLVRELYRAIAGRAWADAELTGRIHDLQRAIEHDVLGRELSDDTADYLRLSPERRVDKFARTLAQQLPEGGKRRPRTDPREQLPWIALKLASDPGGLRQWMGTPRALQGALTSLLHQKVAARAARFLVLATEHHLTLGETVENGVLHAGWEWS